VSNVLGEGYVVSSLPQKVGAAGVLVKKVGRNAESASDASLEGLAEGGSPRSRLGRAAAAIRGATGTKPVQTEAGSDSLENLYDHYVSLGYPVGTARKIASGDLLMDTDSRMQRAAELGYTEPMYVGTSSGADILEFDPDIGTGARQRTGTWGSADKLNANTYASLPKGQMYQLLMKPSEQAEINAGGKNWSMLPSDSTMTLNDGVTAKLSEAGYTRRNTNDLARLARLYGADSLRVNNVRDMGPYGLFEEDVPEFSDTLVVFKPELLRSKLSAAFDPDETKNRNILAGGSGVGLGLGALLASSEEEPQEFSGGGKIRKAAAAVRESQGSTPSALPSNQYIIRPGDIGYDKRVDDRKREQDRIANSIFQYERTADINPPEYSIFDLEGRPFILGMADRTEAASNLLGIEGVDFDIPVRLQGGQNYMFNNPGQVWAADKGAVSAVMNVAKGMDENPLFLPFSMAPTSGDHATMTTDAMLSYARNNMNKREIAKANKLLRSWMPEFKGIDNPDSMRQLGAASGATRKAFQGIMDTEFRNAGGIGIGQARLSVTDPSQYSIPDIMLMNVGEIDRNAPRFKVSGHDTYAQGIPGGGLGRLKEQNVSALHLLPDFVAQRGVNIENPHSEDTYTLRRGVRSGVITDHVLRNIERMLIDRDRGYADGGAVDAYVGDNNENEYAKMIAHNIWDTSKRLGITTQEAMNAVLGTQQQTIGGLGRYSQHIKSK
jgi:hypothetical protein